MTATVPLWLAWALWVAGVVLGAGFGIGIGIRMK